MDGQSPGSTEPDPYRRREAEHLPGPLDGIRVVDLTRARSGPTCTRQLADLGAEVVWVAHPGKADLGGSDAHNLMRDKRSIVLDLKTDGGREALLRLADRADVLVENFRPGVTRRLGIDHTTALTRNPRLVYASISGFGQTGPYARRPGVDQIAQGLGGLMSVTGPPGSGPWRAGIAVSDTAAGTLLTQGILAALLGRERSGCGQWVHTSLLEAMVAFLDFQAVRWLVDGEVPAQAGNDHPTVFPMGTFRAADGHLTIAAAMGWDRFVGALGHPSELTDDPRFADHAGRVAHRDDLAAACDTVLGRASVDHWVRRLNDAGIPAGPVLSVDEVFADPQVRHLDPTRTVAHPVDGRLELLRHPVTLSATPTAVRRAARDAGADTRAVLAEVGYSEAEIEDLLVTGAAATTRAADGWGRA
jgi:crotonobetainyl-CoA:carnitine CoA-transferase CaiB-like acyl-CoA transferase